MLAALVRLRTAAIAAFGLVVIFAQNIVGLLGHATPESLRASWCWICVLAVPVVRAREG
jgi:hypothetical protein